MNHNFDLIELRHKLHSHPEVSGSEYHTFAIILDYIKRYPPDEIIVPLAKTGAAYIYKGKRPGQTVMIRADIDALKASELNNKEYSSTQDGISHLCGHDGHTTILCGLAKQLYTDRDFAGTAILLFQPAEETGKGALSVLNDPNFKLLKPDFIIGQHNIPGYPTNSILIRKGVFASASKGMEIKLFGRSAHAAYPETGLNPTLALSELIQQFTDSVKTKSFDDPILLTIVYATLGELTYGTAPGYAELHATLRSSGNAGMFQLESWCQHITNTIAAKYRLQHQIKWHDEFVATENDPYLVGILNEVIDQQKLQKIAIKEPFRWSEDFGYYGQHIKSLYFGIGAGLDCAPLHDPNYDFPDEIIETGIQVFLGLINNLGR